MDSIKDWFDELSEVQQEDILRGIAEANNNETITHDEAIKLFAKWGLK